MKLSYWEKNLLQSKRDVIIIGGGLVGLSAAIQLRSLFPNYHITILEKQLFGAAASSRNAGFACFGSVSEILADLEYYGEEKVFDIVSKRRKGLHNIKKNFEDIGFEENCKELSLFC